MGGPRTLLETTGVNWKIIECIWTIKKEETGPLTSFVVDSGFAFSDIQRILVIVALAGIMKVTVLGLNLRCEILLLFWCLYHLLHFLLYKAINGGLPLLICIISSSYQHNWYKRSFSGSTRSVTKGGRGGVGWGQKNYLGNNYRQRDPTRGKKLVPIPHLPHQSHNCQAQFIPIQSRYVEMKSKVL